MLDLNRKVTELPVKAPGLPGHIVRDIETAINAGNPLPVLNTLRVSRDRFYVAAVRYAIALLKKTRNVPSHKFVRWYVCGSPAGWVITMGSWSDDYGDSTIQLVGDSLQHPSPMV